MATFALLATTLGCRSGEEKVVADAPATRELPAVDLSRADAGARRQLEQARASVEELEGRQAPAKERAEAYGELGLLYVTYELLPGAAACFGNASELAPEDFRWHYLAAYVAVLEGRLDEAAEGFSRTLELQPDFLPAVLRLARVHLVGGEIEPAERLFRRALELEPAAAPAHEGLGRVAAARGDHVAAVEHFEAALELDPQATALHYALAQSYRALGDEDRSAEHLRRRGDVATRLVDPLLNPLAEAAESAQFYLMQGAEAMDDGELAAAATAYRAALERDPESFFAHRGLAVSLLRLGDAPGALAVLEQGARRIVAETSDQQARQRAELWALAGDVEAAAGLDAAAVGYYEKAVAELGDDTPPDLGLRAGDARARTGAFAEAAAHYDRLLGQVEEPAARALVLEKRATALVNLGRGDEALADFARAAELAPNDERLRVRWAEALEFLGRKDEARRVRQAAGGRPDGEDARLRAAVRSGEAALAAGDATAAAAAYRQALAMAPDDPGARFGLAIALGRLGRHGEAADELARVLAAAPEHDGARRTHVVALVLAGRYGEARVALQEALRHRPRDLALALTQVRLLATAPDPAARGGELALAIAERIASENDGPAARQAMALALAEAGRPREAAALQRRLVDEARTAAEPALLDLLERRLEAFASGRAWVAASPEEIVVELTAAP